VTRVLGTPPCPDESRSDILRARVLHNAGTENEVWLWRAAPIYLPRMDCDLEALLRKSCGAENVSMSDLTLV
jgi:hypothetical protein